MQQRSWLLGLGLLGLAALGSSAPAQDGQGGAGKRAAGGGAGANQGARGAGGGGNDQGTPAERQAANRQARADAAGQGETGNMLIVALDRDFDGALSQNEIDLSVVSLRALDRNGDGSVEAEEMTRAAKGEQPPASEPPAPQPAGHPELQDRDGDGKITESDLGPNFKSHFAEFDKNGDGELDATEQEAVIQKLKAQKAAGKKPGAGAQNGGGQGTAMKNGGKKPGAAKGGGKGGKKKPAGGF